jgi:hypothetical protein
MAGAPNLATVADRSTGARGRDKSTAGVAADLFIPSMCHIKALLKI